MNEIFDYTLTKDLTGDFNLIDEKLIHNDSVVGYAFMIDDHKSHEKVRNKIGLAEWIVLDFSNWKMIPVENIIAECEGTGTKIAVIVNLAKDVNGIAFALEKGADAIVIITDWDQFKEIDWIQIFLIVNKPAWIFDTRICLEKNHIKQIGFNIRSLGSS